MTPDLGGSICAAKVTDWMASRQSGERSTAAMDGVNRVAPIVAGASGASTALGAAALMPQTFADAGTALSPYVDRLTPYAERLYPHLDKIQAAEDFATGYMYPPSVGSWFTNAGTAAFILSDILEKRRN